MVVAAFIAVCRCDTCNTCYLLQCRHAQILYAWLALMRAVYENEYQAFIPQASLTHTTTPTLVCSKSGQTLKVAVCRLKRQRYLISVADTLPQHREPLCCSTRSKILPGHETCTQHQAWLILSLEHRVRYQYAHRIMRPGCVPPTNETPT